MRNGHRVGKQEPSANNGCGLNPPAATPGSSLLLLNIDAPQQQIASSRQHNDDDQDALVSGHSI